LRKKKERNEPKKAKRKTVVNVNGSQKIRSKCRSEFWEQTGCYCGHFYKNARKTLAFSGCLFCLWLILSLGVLREQLGSISCTKNREPAYASVFFACLSVLHGLSFFFLVRLSSFFLERRKKNERKKRNYKT